MRAGFLPSPAAAEGRTRAAAPEFAPPWAPYPVHTEHAQALGAREFAELARPALAARPASVAAREARLLPPLLRRLANAPEAARAVRACDRALQTSAQLTQSFGSAANEFAIQCQ